MVGTRDEKREIERLLRVKNSNKKSEDWEVRKRKLVFVFEKKTNYDKDVFVGG